MPAFVIQPLGIQLFVLKCCIISSWVIYLPASSGRERLEKLLKIYVFLRRRATPTRPSRPDPISQTAAGTGTAFGPGPAPASVSW